MILLITDFYFKSHVELWLAKFRFVGLVSSLVLTFIPKTRKLSHLYFFHPGV